MPKTQLVVSIKYQIVTTFLIFTQLVDFWPWHTHIPRQRLWVLKERNFRFSLFFVCFEWREYSGLIGLIGDQPAYWCYWKQSNKSPFVSVAIKARAEQVYLLCRAAATKRSAANLKGDLGGGVNTDSRKKESRSTLLFSVNPPGLQCFSVTHKLSKSYACFVIYSHTTLFVNNHLWYFDNLPT